MSAAVSVSDPEVTLAIGYAPAGARVRLRAIWAFDGRLADILRTTRDPMIGQLRLTWWYEAVATPDVVRSEPVLAALAAAEVPVANLQRIVVGWEALLDGDDDRALGEYAAGRGGGLFAAAADVLNADDMATTGAGWALVDLARHHSRPDVARRALALARQELARAPVRWNKAARPLGMLAKLARRDLAGPQPQGSPRRIAALAMLALTGR